MPFKINFYRSLLLCAVILARPGFAQQQSPPAVLDPVQGGWQPSAPRSIAAGSQYEDTSMQEDVNSGQFNVDAAFQQFRSDRNSALARNKGDLTTQDRSTLQHYVERIEQQAPATFEAHMARFYLEFPSPTAYMSLDRAAMRDPDRLELIGPKLADAARRDNDQELRQWSRRMKDHGNIAPGLLSFADDLLASVDKDGILFAAGEMDAYPLWTRQFADGSRTDVLVIDVRSFTDPAYRERIWERTRAKGKAPKDPAVFIQELAVSTERPVFLSSALGRDRINVPQKDLYVVGVALKLDQAPVNNIPLLEQRWDRMNKSTEAGPLSRNYLLPGIVLLQHYREQGIEEKAAPLEHELRGLAKKLNATQDLYRAGVLQH